MTIADDFVSAAGTGGAGIPDADLARVITAAVKLYAARAEATEQFPPLVSPHEVSATEALIAICELMRAADVNVFEVSMWHDRREK